MYLQLKEFCMYITLSGRFICTFYTHIVIYLLDEKLL